jgi:hypothetical protein
MLTRDFQPNALHGLTLDGAPVQSAKFGRTQVDVWQEAKPSPIWRGDPKRQVGTAPARCWRYSVHGEMSGSAMTEAAAKALGERCAWQSEANRNASPPEFRHAISGAAEAADRDAHARHIAAIYAAHPVT